MDKVEIIIVIISGLSLVTVWLTYFIKSLYKKGMDDRRFSDIETKVYGYDVRKRECDTKFSEQDKLIAVSYERMAATSDMVNRIYDMFLKNEHLSKRKSPKQHEPVSSRHIS